MIALLLAFGASALAATPETKDTKVFRIGHTWNEKGPPAEWTMVGIVVHEQRDGARPAGPFTTSDSFKKWIMSMPRSSRLEFDAGCVLPVSLTVGKESITLAEIKRLCNTRSVKFVVYVGW